MKVTYRQLAEFRQKAEIYINSQGGKQNKLTYSCMKLRKATRDLIEDLSERETEIRMEKASVDDKGNFVLDAKGSYVFTPAALKEIGKKLRALHNEEVEVEPYIATIVPKDLHIAWYEYLSPFVLNELEEPSDEDCLKSEEKIEPVK